MQRGEKMEIDVDDYNKIRTRERLRTARELIMDIPCAFQTTKRLAIGRDLDLLIRELDADLDIRVIDEV